MSKAQNWHFYFNEIEMLNAKGHEMPEKFAFERSFIIATCKRCGQAFRSRYGAEVGPYDTKGARDFIGCDNALAIDAGRETKEEVTK